ncbi:Glycosyl transferase 2 family protein [Planktothrix agardhii]|uniref:tetratricopeptide repeat protein n=1 Tax=Planktothrix agardhii TaxID=1160 RepID=UPI001B96F478|nr:tetratricopeptide repeat protein [Planktothrix agardhii]CAD0224480.1 Glycosyl transferase 2 family protein [Planktothrix agardhii]
MVIQQQPSSLSDRPQVSSMVKSRRRSVSPAEPSYRLAQALVKQEKWQEAIAAYQQALTITPNWVEVQRELGDLFLKLERWDEAVQVYETAISLRSESAEVYHNLGDALLKLQRWEDAIAAYEKAIELNPEFSWSYNNLGDGLRELQRWDEAAQAYGKAIELKPDFALSHHNLGDILVKKEDWEGAIAAYQKAVDLDPNFVWSYFNLAEILVKMGQISEALPLYRKAVKLQPNLPNFSEKLGDALKKQIQIYAAEAAESYRQAMQYNPDEVELYHKSLEIQPNDPEVYFNLCQALVRKNEFDQALIFYQMGFQALSGNTNNLRKFNGLDLGDSCLKQNKLKEAIFFYQEALHNDPNNNLISWQLQNAIAIKNREFSYSLETAEYLRLVEPKPLILNPSENPLISIIIPVYNQILHTYNCLRSLKETLDESLPFELILIDDHSTDNTQDILSKISVINSVFNQKNLGFIGSCNRGAELAKGEYLVFLNNDTVVMPNCFQEMLATFKQIPNAGLVGAKFLYPNGKLQEAGGIIWQDGSAWNYGRLDHPNKPEYCYLREVDYCSGAGLMIPKHLWEKIGGFDTRYKPAYYEDTDLAFEVRKAGYKVLYQPLAKIVHFEGISSGTDVTKGVKKYQLVNHQKFIQKWQDVLKFHRSNGIEPYLERERKTQKRLLMINACMLTPDKDAGSSTAFNLIKIFQSLDYKVTFAPDNLLYVNKYTEDLQRLGVECLYCSHVTSIQSHLEAYGGYYDIVYLARFEVIEKNIDWVRKFAPQAKIIYDTVDLQYLREEREAKIKNSLELARKAMNKKERELALVAKADCTLVVSIAEKQILKQEYPHLKNIHFFNMPSEIFGKKKGFEERKDLLFIGGFLHPPNVDAVLYFVQDVFPIIQQKLSDIKFFIIGSDPPEEILNLSSNAVVVRGYVPDISEYFNDCKLSVAPLRYGAGIKGKILTSLSYGLPVVGTSMAIEGMEIQDGYDVLVGDTAESFAEQVVNLYLDNKLWEKISKNSLDTISRNYSMEAVTHQFDQLLKSLHPV